MFKTILISIVALFVCLFVFQQLDPNLATTENVATLTSIASVDNLLSITIEGEVEVPGIYKMINSATLGDLIDTAGGLTEDADEDTINEDVYLTSQTYFYIPSVSSAVEICTITEGVEKININTASATEISTLSYISYSLAEKIVAYREEHGDFQTLEELMNVSGIGQATYERIRDYITLK